MTLGTGDSLVNLDGSSHRLVNRETPCVCLVIAAADVGGDDPAVDGKQCAHEKEKNSRSISSGSSSSSSTA